MQSMTESDLLRLLWRRKLVALFTGVLVVVGAVVFLVRQPPVFEARASVAFLPQTSKPETLAAYSAIVERLLPLYATQVRSRTFLDRVATRFSGLSGADLQGSVFADLTPGAAVLQIVARSNDAELTEALARATTDELVRQVGTNEVVRVRVIDWPRVPSTPIAPRPKLVMGASMLLAIVLGAAAAVVWERWFGRIRDPEELKSASGRRVLGVLPYERRLHGSVPSLIVGNPRMAVVEESLRAIRTALIGPGWATPTFRRLAVVSFEARDGRSTLAANLAVVVAEVGSQVLLIDADLHRPRQHEIFGVPNDTGLGSIVLQDTNPNAVLQPTLYAKLDVLTAGPPLTRRSDAVDLYVHVVPNFEAAQTADQQADFVLIDTAPLSVDADVGLLAAMTDGVLVLVRSGSMSRKQLRDAVESLEAVGVPVVGLILTMARGAFSPVGDGDHPRPPRESAEPRERRSVLERLRARFG
jgi:polysaccharide biosynthesis transport protein